jgi:multisubunit Na+/H+ antiporter MnhB subunit
MAACEGVALVAFIVLLAATRRQRRPRDEEEPERLYFPWWAKTAGVLLALGLLVTPLVVLFTLKTRTHAPVPPLAPRVNPLSRAQPPNAPAQSSPWPLIAGMVIAIVVVLVLTLLTRRRRLPGRPNRVDRVAALAQGLAAGSAALQANHEPRAAIIACYTAMEQGFAAAGSAPAAADTPAEVLARATAAGIVRRRSWAGPAEVLTGLFRRARYSAEPMTSADSAAAAAALTRMRADLGVLAPAAAAAGAGAPAGAGP